MIGGVIFMAGLGIGLTLGYLQGSRMALRRFYRGYWLAGKRKRRDRRWTGVRRCTGIH